MRTLGTNIPFLPPEFVSLVIIFRKIKRVYLIIGLRVYVTVCFSAVVGACVRCGVRPKRGGASECLSGWSRPIPVVCSVSANFRQTQSCVWAKCRSMPNSQENHNFIRYTLFQKKTSKRRWAAKKCGYLKTGHSACSSIASYGRARCRAHTNVCTRIP